MTSPRTQKRRRTTTSSPATAIVLPPWVTATRWYLLFWLCLAGSRPNNHRWYAAAASTPASVVPLNEQQQHHGKSHRRPLQKWLQQHLPHLFAAPPQSTSKVTASTHQNRPHHRNTRANPQPPPHKVDAPTKNLRRQQLYDYIMRRHVVQDIVPMYPNRTAWNHLWRSQGRVVMMKDDEEEDEEDAPPQTSTTALPIFPLSLRAALLQQIRDMFTHAYDGYYYHAWPHGELLPHSCQGTNFSLIQLPALTAIDALDTFWVLGNTTEFIRTIERLRQLHNNRDDETTNTSLWNVDQSVSLFETTIRILGGLLSAHQIAQVVLDETEKEDHHQDNATTPPQHIWHHDIWDPVTGQVLDGRNTAAVHVREASDHCPVPPPPLVCAGIPPTTHDCYWTLTGGGSIMDLPPQPIASSCDAVNATTHHKKPQHPTTTAVYQYDGFLLDLALDLANRLLPAFDTPTGIPYGTVNLLTGVPEGETPVASLAGAGTLVLEWELLSQLTGQPVYGRAARLAARALWQRQSKDHHLVGKHIHSGTGHWVESLSGIGSNSDSFIEYLIKYGFVFGNDDDDSNYDFDSMWRTIYEGVYQHMRRGDYYVDTDYQTPSHVRHVMESLMAFYPGLQVWLGEWAPAARSLNAFFIVREYLGFLPERFSLTSWKADGPLYPLRPELLESNYFMHRAVKNVAFPSPFSAPSSTGSTSSGWLWAAAMSVERLSHLKTSCGYATLSKVDPTTTGQVGSEATKHWKTKDDMPSFFLSETLKYLYLTFDEENPLHTDDDRQWMFTTEAHPIHTPGRSTSRKDLVQLEQILSKRLKGQKLLQKPMNRLKSEKWSDRTTLKGFLDHLWPVEVDIKKVQTNNQTKEHFFFQNRDLLGERSESAHVQDDWGEHASRQNLAHLRLSTDGVGSGFSLRSACPNFYASELAWIHALNGDSLDFTVDFVPAGTASDQEKVSSTQVVYGSVEALGHLCMQYTPLQQKKSKGCLIKDLLSSQSDKRDQSTKNDGTLKVETELGTFHVVAKPDGTGFTVVRIDDGFTMNLSFLPSFDGTSNTYESLMLYSEGGNTNSAMGKVSMADFDGNAVVCQVSLLRFPDDGGVDEVEGEEIFRIPCTPAMFGTAHLTNLVRSRGAVVTAPMHLPPPSDTMGCESSSHFRYSVVPLEQLQPFTGEPVCARTSIQMLDRGECSFMTKAINQKMSRDADAIIVVNTEDELFSMANDPEVDFLDANQTPLTVMVSKNHGKQMSIALQTLANEQNRIMGQVKLEFQPKQEEIESLTGTSSLSFPMVYASESKIQIYAEGQWGVEATAVEGNWQLQLVMHRLS